MKPSREARFLYFMGLIVFALSVALYFLAEFNYTDPKGDHIIISLIGMFGLLMFWVLGIQKDLYRDRRGSENDVSS